MTGLDERVAVVALLRRAGLDAPGIPDRLEADGAHAALASRLAAETRLLPEDPAPLLRDARAAIAGWEERGLRIVTVLDEAYPANLRTVHDRPAVLFITGDLTLAGSTGGVAIVGSRRASAGGLARASRLASEFADAGRPVLSGLAAGVDAAAHRAAIAAGGRTVAVIGTGLPRAYPPAHAELQAALARDHAVISPFWPDAAPDPERFRRRNGVMSGLSCGTVIVEASPRSGTRVQARLALAHGRPVFLLESLLVQPWAEELAGRPGVHVVTDGADVLTILTRRDEPLR